MLLCIYLSDTSCSLLNYAIHSDESDEDVNLLKDENSLGLTKQLQTQCMNTSIQ